MARFYLYIEWQLSFPSKNLYVPFRFIFPTCILFDFNNSFQALEMGLYFYGSWYHNPQHGRRYREAIPGTCSSHCLKNWIFSIGFLIKNIKPYQNISNFCCLACWALPKNSSTRRPWSSAIVIIYWYQGIRKK